MPWQHQTATYYLRSFRPQEKQQPHIKRDWNNSRELSLCHFVQPCSDGQDGQIINKVMFYADDTKVRMETTFLRQKLFYTDDTKVKIKMKL